MGGTSAEKPKDKLSCHTFYFETPLYTPINIEDLENDIFDGNVDAYNPLQKFDTTFKIIDKRMGGNYCNYHRVTLVCKRDDDTYLTFFIFEGAKAVVKIGQNPSLADIQFAELGKNTTNY